MAFGVWRLAFGRRRSAFGVWRSSSSSCSKSGAAVASILRTDVKAGFLSRRDNRTEPGVLTPGTNKKTSRPEGGGRTVVSDFCRRSQTKRRSEHLAPLQGASWLGPVPGVTPQAQSYSPRPHRYAKRCGPGLRDKIRILGTKIDLNTCPQNRSQSREKNAFEDEGDDENEAPGGGAGPGIRTG